MEFLVKHFTNKRYSVGALTHLFGITDGFIQDAKHIKSVGIQKELVFYAILLSKPASLKDANTLKIGAKQGKEIRCPAWLLAKTRSFKM